MVGAGPLAECEAGLRGLAAGAAAARACVRRLEAELARREAEARAREAKGEPAVRQRLRVARKRVAPAAVELCELEARGAEAAARLAERGRALDARRADPWPGLGGGHGPAAGGLVRLCVGGAAFRADAGALRAASAWFAALLSGRFPVPRGPLGEVFVDRDGAHFQVILDYVQLGPAGAHSWLRSLDARARRAALEEAAHYGLEGLAGQLAVPAVGTPAAARLPSQALAAAGVRGALRHDVCGQWHAPGACAARSAACEAVGTAVAACLVRGYRHRAPARVRGTAAGPAGVPACAGGGDPAGPLHGIGAWGRAPAPRWELACEGRVFVVSSAQILPEAEAGELAAGQSMPSS